MFLYRFLQNFNLFSDLLSTLERRNSLKTFIFEIVHSFSNEFFRPNKTIYRVHHGLNLQCVNIIVYI